ncbi:component of the Dot/Icm secretion system [Candidatus Rickettsiella viridis]|uniref:Component of the Dot/Icm secretion system n=1 Tax=Candidatus Rickettsiella viridis TaxID=676208 RepID=A0A2Z5UWW4_9COXI|nr:type IVB secretion system protein IcmW [Candidatus Rickettsiella viridis]BBB15605.1 component of the Dot/Icm secretion system [Candidatus Rickettsiella viridis]
MPDLSHKGSHLYWKQYQDPMIYRVLSFMESVEQWTKDGDPSLEAALTQLGQEIDELDKVDLDKLGRQALFIRLGNHLGMSRTLRLLQALDTSHPGSAAKLLIHAEETSDNPEDEAGLFLRRNIAFERLRLLARVFSQDRLGLVLKALEGE